MDEMIKDKEKAIEQAQASLKIDHIYLSNSFLDEYRQRNKLPSKKEKTLCKGKILHGK